MNGLFSLNLQGGFFFYLKITSTQAITFVTFYVLNKPTNRKMFYIKFNWKKALILTKTNKMVTTVKMLL